MSIDIKVEMPHGKVIRAHFGLMNRKTAAEFLDMTPQEVDTLRQLGYLRPGGRPRLWRYDPIQCIAGLRRLARDFKRAQRGRPVKLSKAARAAVERLDCQGTEGKVTGLPEIASTKAVE